jgi:two-component system, NtrC family, nitrogen regulation response regulator GlnG
MKPVWIIDDDKSIRWVIEKALAREGIAYKSFSAANEGLDHLDDDPPQVVISDIRMPGASGLDFMQRLKSRLPATPVIIMTAYSDLESAVAAFQGGAFEYLPKPFDVDHAVELIRRAMDESISQAAPTPAGALESAPEILGSAPTMQEVFRAVGRIRQRQRVGRTGVASPQPARREALHRDQHGRDSERFARERTLRPRARRLHGCGGHAARALRAS